MKSTTCSRCPGCGTIPNFPVFLSTYSWNSENGRNAFTFSEFALTPDGGHIIAPNYADTLFFINTATGAFDDTVTGVGKCRFVEISGDGLKALVVAESSSGCIAHRVDIATRAVDASVTLPGLTLMTFEAAMNGDGSKCYLGVSGNQSALVKFSTGNYVLFSNTYTAFWIGVSPDHARAISGQYNWSLVDFATETVLGQAIGNAQSVGAVSPTGNRAVGYDPHRHEGLYFYDYTTPGPSMYRGTTNAGKDPEGDCPHRLAIAPDGSKALASNVLSDNLSVIDVASGTLDTTIACADRPQEVAVTGDSRWGVTANVGETVSVIDLVSGTTAGDCPVPRRPVVARAGAHRLVRIHWQHLRQHRRHRPARRRGQPVGNGRTLRRDRCRLGRSGHRIGRRLLARRPLGARRGVLRRRGAGHRRAHLRGRRHPERGRLPPAHRL